MSGKVDIILVGSGHNGLIAAAYLARAGKRVLVLERNAVLGGGASTEEIAAPGYFHDLHASFHVLIQANPLLLEDELGLRAQYGLRYAYPDAVIATVFDDGDAIILYRDVDKTCDSIAKISPRDAEAYGRMIKGALAGLPKVTQGMFVPPVPQGVFVSQLAQSPEGRMMMRTMQQSMLDVVNGVFESDKVKIHLLKLAAEMLVAPTEGGTGAHVTAMAAFSHAYSWGIPLGGSRALTNAVIACLEDHGGEVRNGTEVVKVTSAAGAVTGVELASGERISADLVIGHVHPWLLGELVEGIDPALAGSARATSPSPFTFMASHYALRKAPRFRVPDEAAQAAYMSFVPSSLKTYLRIFDDLQNGDLPSSRLFGAFDHARWDPSRAPAGGGALTLLTFCPYALRDGGSAAWDDRKQEWRSHLPTLLGDLCENLTDENIAGSDFQTPLDWERFNPTFQRGDVCGIAKMFDQTGGHRPTPELANYRVPGVQGLYLAGAAMHPAGGITGGGRATAIQMCADLGIDFKSVSSSPA